MGIYAKRMLTTISSCLLAFILVSSLALGLTGSIGNARRILTTEVTPDRPAVLEETIFTRNSNNVTVTVKLVPDQDFEEHTTLIDETFNLEPGETRDARLKLTFDRPGMYEGKVLILFSSAENPQGAKVVLASRIIVNVMNGDPTAVWEDSVEEITPIQAGPEEEPEDEPREQVEEVVVKEDPVEFAKETSDKASPVIGILIVLIMAGIGVAAIMYMSRT